MTHRGERPKGLHRLWSEMPSLKQGSFAYNQSMVLGRNGVVILAQLIFTPIITRLYPPEAYGLMSAVLSVSALLLPFFTLQYDRALLLAKDERDVQGLRALVNLTPTVLSALLMLILLVGGDRMLLAVGLPAMGPMAFLIPVVIVLSAWNQANQQMVAVRMRYRQSFFFGSISVVGSKLTSVLYGTFVGSGAFGLVAAELFSRFSQLFFGYRFILRGESRPRLTRNDSAWLKATARKYIGFPKFELPAVGLGQIANQVPLWWLPYSYGIAAFGQYGLGLSMLEVPMRLFSYSLSSTFYQKAVQVYRAEGALRLRSITFRTMRVITLGSIVPLLLTGLFAESLYVLAFGEQWALAGRITQALVIISFARLTVEPVSAVLRVIGKQQVYVRFHSILLVLRVTAVVIAMQQGLDIVPALFLFALADATGRLFITFSIVHWLNMAARRAVPPEAAEHNNGHG